jgi:hypothetical protein
MKPYTGPFLLLLCCAAAVLLVHIGLRLTGRKQYKITLAVLLIALPIVGVVPFYAPGILTPDPAPGITESFAEGMNRRAVVPIVFASEAAALLMVLGIAELVLLIRRKLRAKR